MLLHVLAYQAVYLQLLRSSMLVLIHSCIFAIDLLCSALATHTPHTHVLMTACLRRLVCLTFNICNCVLPQLASASCQVAACSPTSADDLFTLLLFIGRKLPRTLHRSPFSAASCMRQCFLMTALRWHWQLF